MLTWAMDSFISLCAYAWQANVVLLIQYYFMLKISLQYFWTFEKTIILKLCNI
jgi:hypothetical protein